MVGRSINNEQGEVNMKKILTLNLFLISLLLFSGFCYGTDYSNIDLRNADFSNRNDLAGSKFINCIGCNFTNSNLSGCDFTDANLTGANLTGANLTGANCLGANFTTATLNNTKINGTIFRKDGDNRTANFLNAKVTQVNFDDIDLAWVNFSGAHFTSTSFKRSFLYNADLSNVIGVNVDFTGAHLEKLWWSDRRPDLTNAKFTDSLFMSAYLTSVNLYNTTFTNSNFSGSLLTDAKFNKADFKFVSFSNATLKNVDFSNATGEYVVFTQANLTAAILTSTIFTNSNFDEAKLNNTVMKGDLNYSGSSFKNADLSGAQLETERIWEKIVVREIWSAKIHVLLKE